MHEHYHVELMAKDFTPTGLKIEGPFENDRNACFAPLFKDIIREVYNVTDVIIAHHLVYVKVDQRKGDDGHMYDYQVVQEIPAADTLIFCHHIMKTVFGEARYIDVMCQLAREPEDTRDQLLADLYYGRTAT
jgi:hypothetical protein